MDIEVQMKNKLDNDLCFNNFFSNVHNFILIIIFSMNTAISWEILTTGACSINIFSSVSYRSVVYCQILAVNFNINLKTSLSDGIRYEEKIV